MTREEAKKLLAQWKYQESKRYAKYNAKRRAKWRAEQRHVCYYCGALVMGTDDAAEKFGVRRATVDHKIPLSRGGLDQPDNWAVCCQPCNGRKGKKTEAEFRKTMEAP